MNGSAFVGVSLDSNLFSRNWFRLAFSHILSKHADVQFVLADRLLTYNKLTRASESSIVLDFPSASSRIVKRRTDIHQFITSEIARLPKDEQARVTVASWDDYSDACHANIHRALTIGYLAIPEFQQCVGRVVDAHFMQHLSSHSNAELDRQLCISYVLEETAMIIRITEIANRPFDYYPEEQIETLRDLYQDRFISVGLSVENLVGHPRSRVFSTLALIGDNQNASSISASTPH